MLNFFRKKCYRVSPRIERHTLEGRLTEERYRAQKDASTAAWDIAQMPEQDLKSAADAVVFKRHDNTVRYVVPWIDGIQSLKGAHVLEIGPGCGSSTLAMSHFAESIDAFEIDGAAVAAARKRMSVFGADNVSIHEVRPESMVDSALSQLREHSIVLLLAVLEHMTDEEQFECLSRIWAALSPGQIIVIAETPNYYAWFDEHTFMTPFAHMVPDRLFPGFLRNSTPTLRFRQHLLDVEQEQGTDALLLQRRRLGVGVTHYLFEQATGCDLNDIVIANGFEPPMQAWNPIGFQDKLLISAFKHYDIAIPVAFARGMLSLVMRKPK